MGRTMVLPVVMEISFEQALWGIAGEFASKNHFELINTLINTLRYWLKAGSSSWLFSSDTSSSQSPAPSDLLQMPPLYLPPGGPDTFGGGPSVQHQSAPSPTPHSSSWLSARETLCLPGAILKHFSPHNDSFLFSSRPRFPTNNRTLPHAAVDEDRHIPRTTAVISTVGKSGKRVRNTQGSQRTPKASIPTEVPIICVSAP